MVGGHPQLATIECLGQERSRGGVFGTNRSGQLARKTEASTADAKRGQAAGVNSACEANALEGIAWVDGGDVSRQTADLGQPCEASMPTPKEAEKNTVIESGS